MEEEPVVQVCEWKWGYRRIQIWIAIG